MTKLKKICLAVVFAAVSAIFALFYNDMFSFNNPKFYRQAVEFYNKGDYQNSYYNFSKVTKISPLYKAALFKQGICAQNLGDYPSAIENYKVLLKKFPKSVFAEKARYSLAKCYFSNNQFDEAFEEFSKIKQRSHVNDYAIASNYYLGLIAKNKDKLAAEKYFVAYISQCPSGVYSLTSADELKKLNVELNPAENLAVGEVYYRNKKYSESIDFLKKAKISKAWAYLAISYSNVGSLPQSRAYFDTGLKKYSRDISPELLYSALEEYVQLLDTDAKTAWFELSKIVQKYKSQGEDYVLYRIASFLAEPKNLQLYSKVAYKYPNSEYAPESLWQLFWYNYKNNKFADAKKFGSAHLKSYPSSKSNPKMLFWMAKLALKMHKNSEANGYFNKILTKYPDDYYAFRTDTALKHSSNLWNSKRYHSLDERDFNVEFPINYSDLDIKDMKLINTLLELGDYEIWSELTFENKFVLSWFEFKRGHKSRSVLLAREALAEMDVKPPFGDDVYKLAFPIYWAPAINKNASVLHLNPYLILSLIREESYFNPQAVSSSDAIGLMQLMPSTAAYIAAKYSISQPTSISLKEPATNIRLGSCYFKYVKTSLGDHDLMAVASYNGGPNAVKYWKRSLKYRDVDEFVENIPYSETKTYVKKVYRSYWNYLNIYNY